MNLVANIFLLISVLLQASVGNSGLFAKIESALQAATATDLHKTMRVAYKPTTYQPQPIKIATASTYTPTANAALIYDVTSGQVLVSKNISNPVPMASLTKLMTVLTILQTHHNLDETITIPDNLPPLEAADQKINLLPGEQLSLRDMLKATLIYSANDAANSLAIWDAGSVDNFVDKMNTQAQVWGLHDSHFADPTGLDAEGHHSSARDLLTLSTTLIQSPKVREIVNTEKATITTATGKPYVLTTTNHDLVLPNVFGIKTGQTDNAGQCLILLARNKAGHEIITIVLNSPDRFLESQDMVNYAFNNYIWK
jgi:D-alanyl-D-alanine carboxypeptidase (penicillin-binding protein 5/6)